MVKSYLKKGLASLVFTASLLAGTVSYSQFKKSEYNNFYRYDYSTYDFSRDSTDSTVSRFDKRLKEENFSNLNNSNKNNILKNQVTKYAVLVNGDNEARFAHDISLIYQILLESNFKKENIYILDQYGVEKSIYPVDTTATKENIKKVLSHLEKKIDNNDLFVMHISDHGTKILDTRSQTDPDSIAYMQMAYQSFQTNNLSWEHLVDINPDKFKFLTAIVLPGNNYNYNDYMSEIEFEESISKIKPKLGIVTATICFGYSIIDKLDKNRFIGISASEKDKVSHLVLDDSFMGYFYEAFRNSKESDINKDNEVSIEEAFNYAQSNHTYSKRGEDKPMVVSDINIKTSFIK